LTKNGWCKVLPTWSSDEQMNLFRSNQFELQYGKKVAQRAYDNIYYFGGSIRSNIMCALDPNEPFVEIQSAFDTKGLQLCSQFFKAGFGGTEDFISDKLVHRNPRKLVDDSGYNFNANACVYSFASAYVIKRLTQLNEIILVADARNKYNAGIFRGGDDGTEFELLCLHAFKITDVDFLAQRLPIGAQPLPIGSKVKVNFPPKQILALNWREQKDYLKVNLLYIPPYGNLESGDAFCLIQIKKKWTLVILQCTIAEKHPVNQNGVKVIHDCYTKNSKLKVDDTVIMFMIPLNGKLKTQQPLVTQEKNETKIVTIKVSAQYKIENALVTIDAML
jgi:hypothetical protein